MKQKREVYFGGGDTDYYPKSKEKEKGKRKPKKGHKNEVIESVLPERLGSQLFIG